MKIEVNPVPLSERKPKPTDENTLGFGKIYSDHMFSMVWREGKGWEKPKIGGYENLSLAPSTLVLHYGQTIFEGLKAYRSGEGALNLFRADKNLERFNRSAARLDMPAVPEDMWNQALDLLLELDHEWVPRQSGTALYIRPTMIATEPYLGLKSSSEFLFFIITGPVGAYYPQGFNPVSIQVCEKFSRAGPGGLGAAKTAANYAASLLAEKEAKKAGFTQVLWLDAAERKYVEEVGAMNVLFKIGGKVISPNSETILASITRDSVLRLLEKEGSAIQERPISIDEVIQAHKDGSLEEVFGVGTAAVVSPIGLLNYKGKDYEIANGKTGPVAKGMFEELMGIQYGTRPDPFNWTRQVKL